MNVYAFDSETTTKPPALAYLLGYANIYDDNSFKMFFSTKDFLDSILRLDDGSILYAHNLKFDYSFLFYVLKTDERYRDVVVEEIITGREKKVRKIILTTFRGSIELRDSYAIFSRPLKDVLKGWNKNYNQKLEVEYYEYAPSHISDEMLEYFKIDVLGLCEALRQRLDMGAMKLTTSSDSKSILRDIINEKFAEKKKQSFDAWFFTPLSLEIDNSLRKYYKGGFCFLNPYYKGKIINEDVCVFDVNSMYPDIMEQQRMPYGKPRVFENSPPRYGLYVVSFVVDWCCVKENCCPFITNGTVTEFFSLNYVSEITSVEPVEKRTLHMTNIEFYLFCETYDFGKISFLGGYSFNSRKDLFNDYVEKFREMKENNVGALRECAKLFLNAPSGKFGQKPEQDSYQSVLDHNMIQRFVKVEKEEKPRAFYLPVSIFITANARVKLIKSINKVGYSNFVYCDTDSVHTVGDFSSCFEIHDKKFGAWKKEGVFEKSKYLRTKRYAHFKNNRIIYTCAGIATKYIEKEVCSLEDFNEGVKIPVMRMKMVAGGMQPIIMNVSI